MTRRPPLWTPNEAQAEADSEGEPDDSRRSELKGCLYELPWDVGGCAVEGCFTATVSCLLLLAGGFLLLK